MARIAKIVSIEEYMNMEEDREDRLYMQLDGEWAHRGKSKEHLKQKDMDTDFGGKNVLLCRDYIKYTLGSTPDISDSNIAPLYYKHTGHKAAEVTDIRAHELAEKYCTCVQRGTSAKEELKWDTTPPGSPPGSPLARPKLIVPSQSNFDPNDVVMRILTAKWLCESLPRNEGLNVQPYMASVSAGVARPHALHSPSILISV